MNKIKLILAQMSNVSKPQRQFLIVLMATLMCFRGKANFRNLSRYSDYNEKTYSRWFRRDFDLFYFNKISLAEISNSDNTLIAAVDCSFVNKSGKQTYGLDKFYNGKQGKAEKGLKISTLAIVVVDYNTAYNFSTRKTPVSSKENETRIDQYLAHLQDDCALLPQSIRYLVADGYYSKIKFIEGVTSLKLEQIGKLLHDANLRWLYKGEQKSKGRHRRYDGFEDKVFFQKTLSSKVNFDDLTCFELIDEIDSVKLYTAIVNSAHFKCDLSIVYLVKTVGKKIQTAFEDKVFFAKKLYPRILFSTDLKLAAKDIFFIKLVGTVLP